MELLVALLVMGIGVLGVVGLQMLSLQAGRSAMLGSKAVQLAEDMIDRARANAGGATEPFHHGLALGDPPPTARNCATLDCTRQQAAVFDRAAWKCRLGRFAESPACVALAPSDSAGYDPGLPGGDGAVAMDAGSGLVKVSVQWRDGGQLRSVAFQSRI